MKRTLTIILTACATILLASTPTDKVKAHIESMEQDGSLCAVINELVTSKMVCQVRGHVWIGHGHNVIQSNSFQQLDSIPLSFVQPVFTPQLAPLPECRKCAVCNLHQTKRVTEVWETDK